MWQHAFFSFFFFNDTATTEIYTLSLHDRSSDLMRGAWRELTYAGRRTVLFIDEVHRFSKTQQDSLLSAVEDRIVSLIAATTENPFFSVVSPLLSRSLVLALQPLSDDEIGRASCRERV